MGGNEKGLLCWTVQKHKQCGRAYLPSIYSNRLDTSQCWIPFSSTSHPRWMAGQIPTSHPQISINLNFFKIKEKTTYNKTALLHYTYVLFWWVLFCFVLFVAPSLPPSIISFLLGIWNMVQVHSIPFAPCTYDWYSLWLLPSQTYS